MENYTKSLKLYKRVLKINHNIKKVPLRAGICCFKLNKFSEAKYYFKKLLRDENDDPCALYYLSRIEALNNHVDSCVSYLSMALELRNDLRDIAKNDSWFKTLANIPYFQRIIKSDII